MTRDSLLELIMGQLQRMLLRFAGDREIIGKLSEVFRCLQEENYHQAMRKLGKILVSRKLDHQRDEYGGTIVLIELLEQGPSSRQLTPATEQLLAGPRAEVDEVAALIEKLRKRPGIDYRLRATTFRRASWPARLLLAALGLFPMGMAILILRKSDGSVGYYLLAAAFGLAGLYALILAMVGEKKSVEKTLEQIP